MASAFTPQQTAAMLQHYDSLIMQLHVPAIEREMHEVLFLQPLRSYAAGTCEEDEGEGRGRQARPPSESENSILARAACTGALLLYLDSMRRHQQLTTEVMRRIEDREDVVSRIVACSEAYDGNHNKGGGFGKRRGKTKGDTPRAAFPLEDAQQQFLLLLQEHQMLTLLVVEAVFQWREQLSRPFPFYYRPYSTITVEVAEGTPGTRSAEEGPCENYLSRILEDCTAITRCTLGQSLSLHLDKYPCCSNVDLMRVLRRKQLMQRARLINTGALLRGDGNTILQPPTAPHQRHRATPPTSAANSNDVSANNGHGSSLLPPPAAGYLSGPPGQWGRAKESHIQQSHSRSSSSRHHHHDSGGGGRGSLARSRKRKHSRLLAAERMVLREAAVQERLTEELWLLASEKQRFLPVVPPAGLLQSSLVPLSAGAEDSYPLNKTDWPGNVTLNTDLCAAVAAGVSRSQYERHSTREAADAHASPPSSASPSSPSASPHHYRSGKQESTTPKSPVPASHSSPSTSSSSAGSSSGSSGEEDRESRKLSGEESLELLRQQLLAEHRASLTPKKDEDEEETSSSASSSSSSSSSNTPPPSGKASNDEAVKAASASSSSGDDNDSAYLDESFDSSQ